MAFTFHLRKCQEAKAPFEASACSGVHRDGTHAMHEQLTTSLVRWCAGGFRPQFLPSLSGISLLFSRTVTTASLWVHILAINLFAARAAYLQGEAAPTTNSPPTMQGVHARMVDLRLQQHDAKLCAPFPLFYPTSTHVPHLLL